ncbi:MAG: radical SAM protein [Chthoniobacteraceae bacterium]
MMSLDFSGSLEARGLAQQTLHDQARNLRNQIFGPTVFVRGVVEVSNFCRENCTYCGMRRDNRSLQRFRLEKERLLELLLNERPASITDINLQAGEDPVAVRELVIPLVRELKAHTKLGVSVCLGTLSEREYRELREAGADYYIIKLETGNEAHYRAMQSPGNLPERLQAIRHLAGTGWGVSSGFIVGLPGQTPEMIAETMELLASLPLAGCSVSPFIPGDDTPLAGQAVASLETTLNCVALMRRASPHRIIPAVSAMTLVGDRGYTRAIEAGANLATINLTPPQERGDYLLYKRDRNIMTEERILAEIDRAGCQPATVSISEYLATHPQPALVIPPASV